MKITIRYQCLIDMIALYLFSIHCLIDFLLYLIPCLILSCLIIVLLSLVPFCVILLILLVVGYMSCLIVITTWPVHFFLLYISSLSFNTIPQSCAGLTTYKKH